MNNSGLQRLKLWTQFKGYPFKTNMIIFSVVVTLAILFSVSSNVLLKIALLIPLATATGMAVIPVMEFMASISETIKFYLKLGEAKPIFSSSLSEEISTIASQMKIKGSCIVKVLSGWVNAGMMRDGGMLLGQPIVEEFDKKEREGVIGHELGHRKGHHWIMRFILLIVIIPLLYYFMQLPFPIYINYLLIFAAMGLVNPLISWPLEFQADDIAARYIGAEKVISGLTKLASKAGLDVDLDSYTHPSISRRIKRLRKRYGS